MLGFNFFYISLQTALNDFVISEVQLNLKPSNSRTHIEPNRTEFETANIRTANPNRTQIFCTCEELEPNRTLAFVRTRTERNPRNESFFTIFSCGASTHLALAFIVESVF